MNSRIMRTESDEQIPGIAFRTGDSKQSKSMEGA